MPDLPSGTVAFLFTDIKGSTDLCERDRAAKVTVARLPKTGVVAESVILKLARAVTLAGVYPRQRRS